jgi:hypothetical protein
MPPICATTAQAEEYLVMTGNPTDEQIRQVKQAIEAMSRATQAPTGEQERQAIEEAIERHLILYEEAVKLIRAHFNCTEGWAIQKLREAETSEAVQFYRPGPPDYVEHEKAALYREGDLKYWLTQIPAPGRIEPQAPVKKPAKRSSPKLERAREAINALWPSGPPSQADLLNPFLVAQVIEWLREDYKKRDVRAVTISDKHILRAAGRTKPR